MKTPLRVLLIEDSEGDAALTLRHLKKADYTVTYERVETAAEMRSALENQTWDCVIADFKLPQFDAPAALAVLQAVGIDLPFIVVSGTIGEEMSVALMKAGAHDYLMKDNLTRLVPVIKRELAEAQVRRERRRAELDLRESVAQYRLLADNISDVIWILDVQAGRFTYVSPSVERLRGYTVAEVLAQDVAQVLTFDSLITVQQGTVQGLELAQQGQLGPYITEVEQPRKDGSTVWTEVTTHFHLNADTGRWEVYGVSRDITARRQAEEAHRRAEKRYQALIEQAPDGIVLITREGQYEYISPAARRIFGYGPTEIIHSGPAEATHPDDLPAVLVALNRLLQDPAQVSTLQYRFQHHDGSWRWIESTFSNLLAEPSVGAIVINFRDITDRKQAELDLRASEQKYRRLHESMADGYAYVDMQGRILDSNSSYQQMLGYTFEELTQLTYRDLTLEHWIPIEQAIIDEQVLPRGYSDIYQKEYRRKNGTVFPIEIHTFLIKNDAGENEGMWAIVRDITERKAAEQALHSKIRALQALAEIDQEITAAVEPGRILDLVCQRAAELVQAPKAAIVLRSSDNDLELVASYGLHDLARVKAEFTRASKTGVLNFAVLPTHGPLVLTELSSDMPFMAESIRVEEMRAVVSVVLTAGEALGALFVFDVVPHEWQADDLQILKLLADHTAIALEKLRLFQADRQRAAQLAMLNEIGQAITSTLDLDLVLVTLLEKARRATLAEASSVALIDPATGDLVFRQAMGGAVHSVIGLRLPPGEGVVGWVVEHRQSVKVDDAAQDARVYPLPDTAGFVTRSLLCVPLIVRDRVTGVLELVNSQRGHFNTDEVQLLESVAAQAAIVIENVRLFETEHTARERLETLYRIGQAINSTLEADVILDRLTGEAVRATGASHGSALVAHVEQGMFERRSLRGYSPEEAEQARRDILPLERGVNGRAYRLQQPMYIDDVSTDPDYHPLIATTRSELAVPIVRGGQVIGNLDLQSPLLGAFQHIDLQFLQALTDQVAIALENARLFAETRRQMDELTIVSQVALVGAAGRPFDETVARATAALSRLWPEAALGFLFVDEHGERLRMHPTYVNPQPTANALLNITLEQGLTGWAVRQRQPIRVGDVTQDGRHAEREAWTANIRSEMAAPLVVGAQVIGVVDVATPDLDAFSGEDLRLLTTLAGQLAVVFEKARLDAALAEHSALLEQRVAERTTEIRRQQVRTQAILDALGEGVVVTDVQGTIQYINPAMTQSTGYRAQEVQGQNPRIWQSGQTPVEVYQSLWNTILARQTWTGELVNRRKNRELYFASITAAPILTADGEQLAGFVGIQRDISERKLAESQREAALAALRESEALYHSLVEVMPLSLCRKDVAGRFTFANHQFLAELNWSLADLVGKTDYDIHPPEQAERFRSDDQRVMNARQPLELVEEWVVYGGKLAYVQSVKVPTLNSAGEVSGIQITFWDVSERKRAEEEMRRALEKERELNALKSQFVSLTSHEFRTPLTAILSSAEMLQHYSDRWSAERRLEHLQRIQTAVKYMTGMLNNILVVAKAEANRLEFVPVLLDVEKFCRDMVEEFELTDKGKHPLTFASEGACSVARLDEQLLRHILSNLLTNALKYSPPGRSIEFDLMCGAGQVVLRIRDHGMGIPQDDQARLFETFHRARNARNIPGTGLGLTIVKHAVDLHGGTIEVDSQVDVGTTVTVRLPIGV